MGNEREARETERLLRALRGGDNQTVTCCFCSRMAPAGEMELLSGDAWGCPLCTDNYLDQLR